MSEAHAAGLEALSDHDAVTLLFDLAGRGEHDRDGATMDQLDAVIFARLLQAYGADELSEQRQRAA